MNRIALPVLALFSTAAFGHPGHETAAGFSAGLTHPLLGLDHLLVLFALGIWAAQGRAALIAPLIFIPSMFAGALFALNGGALPFAEHGIALSVLAAGLLVALVPAQDKLVRIVLPLVAAGAVLHGYAHGVETPAEAGAASYIGGFILATAGVQAAGMVAGRYLQSHALLRRGAGFLVAAAGSVFILAL